MKSSQRQRVHGAVGEQMTVESNGDGTYLVKDEYEVDPDTPTCTCPDHQYRDHVCKHIIRTNLEILWGNVEREGKASPTPDRPDVLSPDFESMPATLKGIDHWVCWGQKLHENKDGSQRWTKVPLDVTGGFASSTDRDTWATFEDAKAFCESPDTDAVGVGFVVSDSDAFIGIDIDDCRDPDTGELDPVVTKLLRHVDTYAEVSPSGTGVRIFVIGHSEVDGCEADLPRDAHIEMYDTGRYLTVTGRHVEETPADVMEDADTLAEFEKRIRLDTDDEVDASLGEFGA